MERSDVGRHTSVPDTTSDYAKSVNSILRDTATRSKTEYETCGLDKVNEDDWRTRDDFHNDDSYASMLAQHWAEHVPGKYKFSYNERVLAFMRPKSREEMPNYSVGTRGLPFISQLPFDGTHRGNGLY